MDWLLVERMRMKYIKKLFLRGSVLLYISFAAISMSFLLLISVASVGSNTMLSQNSMYTGHELTFSIYDSADDNIWNNINYIYFSCLVISLIGDLYVIYKLIRLIIKIYKSRSNYDKTLRKILKEYDSIITNAENILDESDYKVLNLSSFDELRDAHDNLGSPIIYNELIPGKLSCFSIIDDNLLYKYTLDAKNLKEKWRQK